MNLVLLKILLFCLCVWDTVATYYLVTFRKVMEGNPLMDAVIQESGWGMVWFIKIGLALIIIYTIPSLFKTHLGKSLLGLVFASYLFVAFIHIFLFTL